MNEAINFKAPTAGLLNSPDVSSTLDKPQKLASSNAKYVRNVERIKKLVWLYFWLLIFEGVLRKWILPSFANPLLIVRDPVVLAIYFFTWRAGLFPRNSFLTTLGIIAGASLIAGIFLPTNTVPTAFYGFRANFLHLPLIFVMGRVLNSNDIKKFGYWTLILAMPLAILMSLQFLAPPMSVINAGVMGDFEQITGVRGRIRPPATFSFATGPIYFFGVVAAFLLNTQFARKEAYQPLPLLALSAAALVLAMAVSISRSLVANVGLVFLFSFVAALFLQPRHIPRWILGIALSGFLLYAGADVPLVKEGFSSLVERSEGAAQTGEALGGGDRIIGGDMAVRVLAEFTAPISVFFEAPLWGHGLGLGTNGGAALADKNAFFISQEGEWSRNILESGPVLGGAFILWRICLTLFLGWASMRCALRSNILPLLLFAICGVLILYGMLPQPTAVGFLAIISGLCYASMKNPLQVKSNSSSVTPAVMTSNE